MADSAVEWEVIIVANRCVYRENVLNEKCFFLLVLYLSLPTYARMVRAVKQGP